MSDEKFPIEIDEEYKIKIKTELMVEEKLYPFIYENSVFLFYKDENKLINCYEISDKDIKDKMLKNPTKIIDILEEIHNNQ